MVRKRRIIVVGSINMDIVLNMDAMPKLGESVFGRELHFIPGGKGANQAVAASRLGARVAFTGKLGSDPFGKSLRDFLEKENVDIKNVKFTENAPTGTAVIIVDKEARSSITVIKGSNYDISESDTDFVKFKGSDIVLSQFEVPPSVIHKTFKRAKSAGAKIIFNPSPVIKSPKKFLDLIDYLVLNEHEISFFSGRKFTDDVKAIKSYAKKLRTRPDQTIIVTLGARGALCIVGDKEIRVQGIKVKAVDTTAAGDCFVGAFAAALSEDKDLKEALEFANAAASISVQRFGASASLPARHEVDKIL